jgi:hypothetical protein
MSTPKLVPIEQVYVNGLGQKLNPGNSVITFSGNHSGCKITSGVYLGVKIGKAYSWSKKEDVVGLIIQREHRRTVIHHLRAFLPETTLAELDGYSV